MPHQRHDPDDPASSRRGSLTAVAVIPARFGSTRLPGKPLLSETGQPLIKHIYDRVAEARSVERVIVATDDDRIADAVRAFGGQVVMTRADHPSGTDRVAEVAAGLTADIIVNVQGDEPEIEPESIDGLVEILRTDREAPMATLACPISAVAGADPGDPSIVKVVVDRRGRALYFSRSVIPYVDSGILWPTDGSEANGADEPAAEPLVGPLLHVGVYAYRRSFLLSLSKLEPTPLEHLERLEQLRVLEHGFPIAVVVVPRASVGIDTPADYESFVRRWEGRRRVDR